MILGVSLKNIILKIAQKPPLQIATIEVFMISLFELSSFRHGVERLFIKNSNLNQTGTINYPPNLVDVEDYALSERICAGQEKALDEETLYPTQRTKKGYLHNMTLEEVAEIIGVTRERVRQIEKKALKKLRHLSQSRRLRAFYFDV